LSILTAHRGWELAGNGASAFTHAFAAFVTGFGALKLFSDRLKHLYNQNLEVMPVF